MATAGIPHQYLALTTEQHNLSLSDIILLSNICMPTTINYCQITIIRVTLYIFELHTTKCSINFPVISVTQCIECHNFSISACLSTCFPVNNVNQSLYSGKEGVIEGLIITRPNSLGLKSYQLQPGHSSAILIYSS